jgi:hypothetical protein
LIVGKELTVKVKDAQLLLKAEPLKFLAKYVVVVEGETIILLPVPICPVVAHVPVNQYTVPEAPVAVNVTFVPAPEQILAFEDVIPVGSAGGGAAQVNANEKAALEEYPCTRI